MGSLYCSACCLRSETSCGKTPSNSLRVVGMMAVLVARGTSVRANEIWLYGTERKDWRMEGCRSSGLESLRRL